MKILEEKEEKEQKKKEETIKPKEEKKPFDVVKYGAFASVALFMVAGVIVIAKGITMNKEESLLPFIYTLSMGWFVVMLMFVPLFVARKEVWNKFKVFGRKSRVIILRMIGGDANEIDVIVTLKGNTMEIGENKVIINPRKTTMRDGVRVLTFVADNALAHDYFQDPNKTLKQIAEDLQKNKAENQHDIFTDPIRIDAKYFNETFLSAQQTNPDILKQIISFLTSKSILTMLGVIALAAAAAAFFGLQTNDILNTIPFCNPTQITP